MSSDMLIRFRHIENIHMCDSETNEKFFLWKGFLRIVIK